MASYPALDLRFAPGPGAGTLQDMLYAELDAFEPVAIHEHEAGDGWRVFFRTAAQRDGAGGALASEFGNALELHAIDVDDEDWARRSQASLKAVRAGRIVIAPPWDVSDSRDSRFAIRDSEDPHHHASSSNRQQRAANRDIVIVIDPSTGFGTGHHATTRLCLELLQEIEVHGKRVIDLGTGSGVLAIAAAKLGADEVIAIDNDPDALRNARDNVQRNGAEIEVLEADLSNIGIPPADIVLANLTSAILKRFAQLLRKLVLPGGVLIVSGFSADALDPVVSALAATVKTCRTSAEWAAAALFVR